MLGAALLVASTAALLGMMYCSLYAPPVEAVKPKYTMELAEKTLVTMSLT